MKKAKKVTIKQKAKKAGIPAQLVYNRMNEGWSEKKALSVPVRKRAKPKKVEPKKVDDQLWGTEARKKKVEPKKAPSPLSQRMNKENPIPIQKFEGNSRNWQVYVIVVLAVVLIVAIVNT